MKLERTRDRGALDCVGSILLVWAVLYSENLQKRGVLEFPRRILVSFLQVAPQKSDAINMATIDSPVWTLRL